MKDPINKSIRIGIIGAGPAGLSAAEALREKGYKNVTVLEKRNRVGGQAFSKTYITPSGDQIFYDIGSIQPVSTGVGVTRKLFKRYHVKLGKYPHLNKPTYIKFFNLETKETTLDYTRYLFGQPLTFKVIRHLIHDAFKLGKVLFKYRTLAAPGFDNLTDAQLQELSIPFEQWVDQLKLTLLGENIKVLMGTIFTFGRPQIKNEISAIMLVKIILQIIKYPPRYINGSIMQIRDGYAAIWGSVAAANNVKLNVNINKIERRDNIVVVTTESEIFEFDKLIMACPAFETMKVLDLTEREHELFASVRYSPGIRAAFLAKNLPKDAFYFFDSTYKGNTSNRLLSFGVEGKVDEETGLYCCLISCGQDQSVDTASAQASAEKSLRECFKATDIQWIATAYWQEYGAHISLDKLSQGFYRELTAMQGIKNTYFTGEAAAVGLHSIVSNFSYYLVDKYF